MPQQPTAFDLLPAKLTDRAYDLAVLLLKLLVWSPVCP